MYKSQAKPNQPPDPSSLNRVSEEMIEDAPEIQRLIALRRSANALLAENGLQPPTWVSRPEPIAVPCGSRGLDLRLFEERPCRLRLRDWLLVLGLAWLQTRRGHGRWPREVKPKLI